MRWSMSLSCPGDRVVTVGQAVSLSYTITNTGNIAESYDWKVTDPKGWVGGDASGSTAVLAPGASEIVTRNGTVGSGTCADPVAFVAAAPGDVVGAQRCNTTLSIAPYTITASASSGGSITPSGAVSVACGASQGFGITPDAGYHISDVLVDGASVGTPATYTFTDVQANHTIAASFALIPAVIAAQSTSTYLCPTNTCVRLPVTISRQYTNP